MSGGAGGQADPPGLLGLGFLDLRTRGDPRPLRDLVENVQPAGTETTGDSQALGGTVSEIKLIDVRDGVQVSDLPVSGPTPPDKLDVTGDPPVGECAENNDLPINTDDCTVDGIWNGCSLEAGCEALMLQVIIEDPDIPEDTEAHLQMFKPDGSVGWEFTMDVDEDLSQYSGIYWVFFVAKAEPELWERGQYELRITWEGPNHPKKTVSGFQDVKVNEGRGECPVGMEELSGADLLDTVEFQVDSCIEGAGRLQVIQDGDVVREQEAAIGTGENSGQFFFPPPVENVDKAVFELLQDGEPLGEGAKDIQLDGTARCSEGQRVEDVGGQRIDTIDWSIDSCMSETVLIQVQRDGETVRSWERDITAGGHSETLFFPPGIPDVDEVMLTLGNGEWGAKDMNLHTELRCPEASQTVNLPGDPVDTVDWSIHACIEAQAQVQLIANGTVEAEDTARLSTGQNEGTLFFPPAVRNPDEVRVSITKDGDPVPAGMRDVSIDARLQCPDEQVEKTYSRPRVATSIEYSLDSCLDQTVVFELVNEVTDQVHVEEVEVGVGSASGTVEFPPIGATRITMLLPEGLAASNMSFTPQGPGFLLPMIASRKGDLPRLVSPGAMDALTP